jgi:site-specific DNA-methyltransferase (adenine-specific)
MSNARGKAAIHANLLARCRRPVIIGDATLYLGDARELMETIDAVDAVVTDPPFGIGFSYDTHDDKPSEYEALLLPVVGLAQEITNGGPCFFWQSMKTAGQWHKWFPADYRIFAACKAFVQLRPVEIQYSWDPVIFWGCASGKNPESIRDWHVQSTPNFGAGRESIDHPCPRPLEQVEYIVSGLRVASVLDPFMGSGTTGLACLSQGKRFVGIEIDPKYFDVACARIERASRQPRMFARPQPATQEPLL